MKLKICGINDLEILAHAVDLQVDYLGFIYFDQSPRAISIDFLSAVSSTDLKLSSPVVVLVNPETKIVDKVLQATPQAILQFHGTESDDYCAQFGVPYWKSVPIKNEDSLFELDKFPNATKLLLENYSAHQLGGSGVTFDWGVISEIQLDDKFVLAGGINANNIKDAMALNPWCIDVNSGVESNIAVKDKALITNVLEIFHG
jgi:phosphoribosylanthranilate isomerase